MINSLIIIQEIIFESQSSCFVTLWGSMMHGEALDVVLVARVC